jgi:predicted TPR repeat methyltransferase
MANLDQAVAQATALLRAGQTEQAEPIFEAALKAQPDHFCALHFLGVLRFHCGRPEEGMALVQRALARQPDDPDAHANFGNMLLGQGRFDDAEVHLQRALSLAPEAMPPAIALSLLHRFRGRLEEAERLLESLVERDPRNATVRYNLARVFFEQGRVDAGLPHLEMAISLASSLGSARALPGITLVRIGSLDEAVAYFRKWLEEEPDNATARHLLSACGGDTPPARASDAYVRETFDSFSRTFDVKLGLLEYRAPQLVAQAIGAALGPGAATLAVLDAGCGTGLLGPLLRPYSAQLVGVDLSRGMLEQAKRRRTYDELVEAELTAYLAGHGAAFDLIACADTLCYFGDLAPVLKAAHDALRPQGLFVFTVEHADAAEAAYRLHPHGRYSHTRSYIVRALAEAGFAAPAIAEADLRRESGKPVVGLVASAMRVSP